MIQCYGSYRHSGDLHNMASGNKLQLSCSSDDLMTADLCAQVICSLRLARSVTFTRYMGQKRWYGLNFYLNSFAMR
jgi:hypothetical protein